MTPTTGFQVTYGSRSSNSAGVIKEIYYSYGGELNLSSGKVTSAGGLSKKRGQSDKIAGQPARRLLTRRFRPRPHRR